MLDLTQFYFPFTSIDGDRRYNAKDFATYFHSIFTDGVIATVKDKLRVSQSEATGMHVVVNTGAAFIHGHLYLLGEPMTVDVTPGNSAGDRVDSIVLQLDHLERDMKILYKQNSTNVQRDENYWELQIATINVPRNATQVLNSQINDMRASENVAGYSKLQGNLDVEGMEQHYESLLQQLSSDMTAWVSDKKIDFQGDWDAWFTTTQNTLEQLVTDMQGWTDDKQLEFQTDWDTWFATVQGALDGDTAGNLLSKINAHELKEATETELGHVRLSDIPIPTKESIGLGNVDNVKQASKVEHDQLASDFNAHQAEKATLDKLGHVKAETDVDGRLVIPSDNTTLPFGDFIGLIEDRAWVEKIVESPIGFGAILSHPPAMSAILGSETAMDAVINNQAAIVAAAATNNQFMGRVASSSDLLSTLLASEYVIDVWSYEAVSKKIWEAGSPTVPFKGTNVNVVIEDNALLFKNTAEDKAVRDYWEIDLDLTSIKTLNIETALSGPGPSYAIHMRIYVDDDELFYLSSQNHSWTNRSIDVTDYSGICTLRLEVLIRNPDTDIFIGFRNIQLEV